MNVTLTVLTTELFVMLIVILLNVWSDRKQRAREACEEAEKTLRQNAVIRECLQELLADVEDLKHLKADVDARLWAIKNKQPDAMVN